ncbi:MAG: hypothetical protein EU533_04780 [Promethearchaeota archaeon]|nr:MAG: hypothetical protein EU533_04780 [Candidatus Lokiarchaeota archaeon]
MDSIDNLKKLFLKENWRYLVLVIWLLVGVGLIQFKTTRLVGLISFLPFLTFLMYLFLFSLFAKKDVQEVAPWKVLLIFFLPLPVMLLIAFFLIVVFAFSILSYFFLTSWFILYGAFLSSRRLDRSLKEKNQSKFLRWLEFCGGLAIAVLISVLYILNSQEIGAYLGETIASVINLSNYVVIFVLIVIGIFTSFVIIFLFKKVFVAWMGPWFILLVIYTFYLLIKIFLAFRSATGTETSSLFTQVVLVLADFGILLYTISTLMGSQAQMLMKRLNRKRIGLDTIVLWLVFSKVAYEFTHYFPYSDLDLLINWFPNVANVLIQINADWVNLFKNIVVLAFFLLSLLVVGFYQFMKYFKDQTQVGDLEVDITPEKVIAKLTDVEEKLFFDKETEEDLPKEGFNYIQSQYEEDTEKEPKEETEKEPEKDNENLDSIGNDGSI